VLRELLRLKISSGEPSGELSPRFLAHRLPRSRPATAPAPPTTSTPACSTPSANSNCAACATRPRWRGTRARARRAQPPGPVAEPGDRRAAAGAGRFFLQQRRANRDCSRP
jgi:hypothetical protein